jgi:Plant transposon protein
MHAHWKNCPSAWQGAYKGKEGQPTIVLEAMADYHCFFWHVFFGGVGTLNDKSILLMSHLFNALLNGQMEELEQAVVPFRIGPDIFDKIFILVDGIYPDYSRFVKGLKVPVTRREKKFAQWQEACRKDIERAFGILQGKFQCMARPFHQLDLDRVSNRVACCLILHNMCVSDRVMDGDVRARYRPDISVETFETSAITYPPELRKLQRESLDGPTGNPMVGVRVGNRDAVNNLTRLDHWTSLDNKDEYVRLTTAIMNVTELMANPRLDKRQS